LKAKFSVIQPRQLFVETCLGEPNIFRDEVDFLFEQDGL